MKNKETMDVTSNRSVYNRSRKVYLETKGKIHCAWCKYHSCENDTNKYYGTLFPIDGNIRYPNWKLVSKNEKQWMVKPVIRKKKHYRFFEDYYSFEF